MSTNESRQEDLGSADRVQQPQPQPPQRDPKPGALVVSRRQEEAFTIGDEISVQIIQIKGGRVRLRIIAPKDVPIHRVDRTTPQDRAATVAS